VGPEIPDLRQAGRGEHLIGVGVDSLSSAPRCFPRVEVGRHIVRSDEAVLRRTVAGLKVAQVPTAAFRRCDPAGPRSARF